MQEQFYNIFTTLTLDAGQRLLVPELVSIVEHKMLRSFFVSSEILFTDVFYKVFIRQNRPENRDSMKPSHPQTFTILTGRSRDFGLGAPCHHKASTGYGGDRPPMLAKLENLKLAIIFKKLRVFTLC